MTQYSLNNHGNFHPTHVASKVNLLYLSECKENQEAKVQPLLFSLVFT